MGGVPNFTFSLALRGLEERRKDDRSRSNKLLKFKFSLFTLIQKKKYIDTIIIGTKKRGKSELVCMLQ